MKQQLNTREKDVKNLVLLSPILDYPPNYAKNLLINLNIRFYSNQDQTKRFQVSTLKASINATVETIVYNALGLFDIVGIDVSKYILKIHGLEEYLSCNATLGQLKYIHECLIENKEPILVLTDLNSANIDLNQNLDEQSELFQVDILNHNSYQIIKNKLENVLKSIIQNRNSLESSVSCEENFSLDSIINWLINLKEKIKYLKASLFDLSYDAIEKFIYQLELSEKKLLNHRNSKYLKEKEPFLSTMSEDYSYRIETSSNPNNLDEFLKALLDYINKSLQDIVSYVNCASSSFLWLFKLNPIFEKKLNKKKMNRSN